MKKLILVIVGFSLTSLNFNAQSFQHNYGNQGDQVARGSYLDQTGSFCIVGRSISAAGDYIYFSHPDNSGYATSLSNFNYEYAIYDASTGAHADAEARAVTEFNQNGQHYYALVGNMTLNNNSAVFFMIVDATGAIVLFKPMDYINAINEIPVDIVYDQLANSFVFTGNFDPANGGPSDIFITEITPGGIVLQNYLFDIQPNPNCSHEISHDKVADLLLILGTPNNYFMIAGTCNDQWGQTMGFIASVAMGVGGTALAVYSEGVAIYGTDKIIEFNSIELSSNGGFIIGGKRHDTDDDFLVTLLDGSGSVVWNTALDYGASPGRHNACIKVKEDLSSGSPEYCALGNTTFGFFGGDDLQFVKLDANGNGILKEVTYGSSWDDKAVGLDIENVSNGLYFTGESGHNLSLDHYLVRTNINGTGRCPHYETDILEQHPSLTVEYPALFTWPLNYVSDQATIQFLNPLGETGICRARSRPTSIDESENTSKTTLYPNPFNENINIEFPHQSSVKISFFDISGKIAKQVDSENNTSSININTSSLPKGIYFVKVTEQDGTLLHSEKIIK